MLKKFRNILLLLLQIIIFVYILMLIFLYFYQRNLMYHPNENNYSDDQITVNIKKVKINTSDNIELLGWYHEKDLKKHKTVDKPSFQRPHLVEMFHHNPQVQLVTPPC